MKLNPGTGRITGALKKAGEFKVKLQAKNAIGSAGKTLRIVVGERIALTPPLGWNSWNCWGNQVDADKVLLSAPLLIGCDLEKLDDFTLGLLTNDEVLAVDHDSLGKSATCVSSNGTTNLANPLNNWARLLTNQFDTTAISISPARSSPARRKHSTGCKCRERSRSSTENNQATSILLCDSNLCLPRL